RRRASLSRTNSAVSGPSAQIRCIISRSRLPRSGIFSRIFSLVYGSIGVLRTVAQRQDHANSWCDRIWARCPTRDALMQSKRAGLAAVEDADETIAADARFNMRILDEVRSAGDGEHRWMQLLEFGEEIIKRCEAAVSQFVDGGAHEPLM